jgi:hypothetical protein
MENEIKTTLAFINQVIEQERKQELEEGEQFFVFLHNFMKIHKKMEEKLPYHVNIIDELHANENAHSRILTKLLQQKTTNNRFEILESFIDYLIDGKPEVFRNIKIEKPEITQEVERIDLWIRDNNYSIIIENKIHYASDQERQLERYIDKTIDDGFKKEQIYVIYLSRNYGEPAEQSWGKYKEEFKDRYLNLSFREDILFWLKDRVLPDLRLKDVFLRSAIEQYIDHLEGMFEIRNINNIQNMELKEFIKEELGLNGTPTENTAKLMAKKEEINKVNNQIDSLMNDYQNETDKDFFQKCQKIISDKYPGYKSVYEEGSRAGLIVPIKDSTKVRVSIFFYDGKLCCQIDMNIFKDQTLPEEVRDMTKDLLPLENDDNQIWQYYKRNDYDNVFECLLDVLTVLTQEK